MTGTPPTVQVHKPILQDLQVVHIVSFAAVRETTLRNTVA
jgi:hypothetical protein